jgi:hypothetical protein
MDIKKKETIKLCVAISIFIMIVAIVVIMILKYQVNGETNMPFNLSKITIVSTAEGEQNKEDGGENYKWNFNINQSNDVYFNIEKNEEYKRSEIIKSVEISNISIKKNPSKGTIKVYMPNSGDGRRYVYDDSFLVKDKLEYNGAKANNEKNLEIGNQGGNILIRFANADVANYTSNDDTEIVHDGTLLKKTGITNEELQFTVNFDFIINTGKINYKANISLDLPYGNILENGKTELEKTDMSDIVFKRI